MIMTYLGKQMRALAIVRINTAAATLHYVGATMALHFETHTSHAKAFMSGAWILIGQISSYEMDGANSI